MTDHVKAVMPDLIGHPWFACMDTRVRGYDRDMDIRLLGYNRDMDTRLRGYDRKIGTPDHCETIMPDLIGHPCLQNAGSSGQARG
ncbi:hypothetical protein B9Z34_08155 [Limnohabitans sp. Hippo3]|nr:hypothetical protein B9Z34_08155 [Limnohabitans sp. Hippo3]